MQNIVITGAAGFIGSSFANNLINDKNINLILIDSLEFGNIENLEIKLRDKLIVTDCQDLIKLEEVIPEESILFHFAGISSLPECESNYISSINNIFNSTVNVYEIGVKKRIKKFVFASTSAVYENSKQNVFKEDLDVNPDLMYSYAKKISEDFLHFRSLKNDAVECVILRFFNVFGYNQDIYRKNPPLTAYLINCIKENKEAIIYNDDPTIKRDYIFITDLISILKHFILSTNDKRIEVFNVTSGNSYSVLEILDLLLLLTKKEFKYSFQNPGNIWSKYPDILKKVSIDRITKEVYKSSQGDNNRLKMHLPNNFGFTSMEEGLKYMLEY